MDGRVFVIRRSLSELAPDKCKLEASFYLDSVGLMTSLANKIFLHQDLATQDQIRVWDRWIVPLSQHLDWLTRYRFGRSVICVWQKDPDGVSSAED